jgi:hypothetical protein
MALAGAVLGGRYVLDQQIGNGGYGEPPSACGQPETGSHHG